MPRYCLALLSRALLAAGTRSLFACRYTLLENGPSLFKSARARASRCEDARGESRGRGSPARISRVTGMKILSRTRRTRGNRISRGDWVLARCRSRSTGRYLLCTATEFRSRAIVTLYALTSSSPPPPHVCTRTQSVRRENIIVALLFVHVRRARATFVTHAF